MTFGNIRKLNSGRYQARYRYAGANFKAPGTFKTRGLAQGWLNAEEKLITFGEWTPPERRAAEKELEKQRHALTVKAWLEQYHDGLTVRASTLQTYRRTVRNRITDPRPPGDKDPDVTRLADIPLVKLPQGEYQQAV